MNQPEFAPGTSKEDVQNINTPEGRRSLFNEKIDALIKPKAEGGKGLSLDGAIFTMRGNKEDRFLLAAMGMGSHSQAHQALLDRFSGLAAITPGSEDLAPKKLLKPLTASDSQWATRRSAAVARNARHVAFNSRIDELTGEGFSVDQSINQMRANAQDAALLAAMNGPIVA